jgi:hypothetical protein
MPPRRQPDGEEGDEHLGREQHAIIEALNQLDRKFPTFDGNADFYEFQRAATTAIEFCETVCTTTFTQQQLSLVLRGKVIGSARDVVDNQIANDANARFNYAGLMSALETRFGDKDKPYKAVDKFLKLYQGQQSVAQFSSEFNKWWVQLPKDINDLKTMFYLAKLHKESATLVRAMQTNNNFEETVTLAIKLGNQSHHKNGNASSSSRTDKPSNHTPTNSNDSRTTELQRRKEIAAKKLNEKKFKSAPEHPNYYPKDLNGPAIGNAAFSRFLDYNNICRYCRTEGHKSNECPFSNKQGN